jgi:GNAT superfamily N-acetyltransferase
MTIRHGVTRIVRALQWRLAWPTHLQIVVWSPGRHADGMATPGATGGLRLVRMTEGAEGTHHIAAAMRAAGEDDGLVAPRLAHGDEFFGWAEGGRIISFGWVMTRDRTLGPYQLSDAPGRVFLYNFHTLAEHRGRGLGVALHDEVRHALGNETAREFVADFNFRNASSRRCLEKSGFLPVARLSYLTLFRRWHRPLRLTCSERDGVSLFQAHTPRHAF